MVGLFILVAFLLFIIMQSTLFHINIYINITMMSSQDQRTVYTVIVCLVCDHVDFLA